MTESTQKILVTGAAGFLGSHLADSLIAAGHHVVALDNLSMGSAANLAQHENNPRFRFVQADVTDAAAFATQDGDFDSIVHLAAFKIPRYGKAIDTLRINYQGTDNALAFAARIGRKCVIASTSDIYGRNPKIPFAEDSDSVIGSSTVPRWAYAVSKLFDEHLAFAYQDSYGIPVTVLRFFGSFGPRQHLSWWGGPPPVFINAAFNGEEIPVHGDGLQTRSFTYIDDCLAGVQRLMHSEVTEPLNIGSDQMVTVNELLDIVERIAGIRLKRVYDLSAPKGVRGRNSNNDRIKKLLDWAPSIRLESGMEKTYAWIHDEIVSGRESKLA